MAPCITSPTVPARLEAGSRWLLCSSLCPGAELGHHADTRVPRDGGERRRRMEGVGGANAFLKQLVFVKPRLLPAPASADVVFAGLARSIDPGRLAAADLQPHYRNHS